jgi:serine/threonine-protein kinase
MQPSQLGPYTITATLGRGGMGAVYEATDATTGDVVAVKTLAAHLGDDPALRRRFLAEIDTLKSLRHPCIVRLLAFGEDDGRPFFAMELVRGQTLEQILRGGRRFDWRETVEIGLAITRALKSAHDHGVVHRDLKPANLLFPAAPAADAPVKLADFGIARLFGATGQTVAGTIVGTAEYMAPEQAAGNAIDHRVDLYALGLVLYAMLAGRPPFHGGEVREILRRQQTETAARISTLVEGVPPGLDDLINRLLAKDPARRPASALAVGRLLSAVIGAADVPKAATGSTRPGAAVATPTAAGECDRPTIPATPDAPLAADVDLLAVTRATRPGDTSPAPVAVLSDPSSGRHADADAATKPIATGDGASAGLARQPTEPDHRRPAADPRPAVSRFVTLEDLHRASREEARARWWRDVAARVATGLVIAALIGGGGYLLLRPPTADELHARIMAIAGDPDGDLRDARPLIASFLAAHGNDPRVAGVRDVGHTLDLDTLERRARRRRVDDRDLAPLEREYRAAMAREPDGAAACIAALEAVLALHAGTPTDATAEEMLPPEQRTALWLDLIRRQIASLEPRARRDREEDEARVAGVLAEAEGLATAAATATDDTDRGRLLDRRRSLLAGIVELYADRPHLAEQVERARGLLAGPPTAPSEDPPAP